MDLGATWVQGNIKDSSRENKVVPLMDLICFNTFIAQPIVGR